MVENAHFPSGGRTAFQIATLAAWDGEDGLAGLAALDELSGHGLDYSTGLAANPSSGRAAFQIAERAAQDDTDALQ